MSGDPYDGHNPLLVLLLALAGLLVTPWVGVRAVVLLIRAGATRSARTGAKGLAVLAWAGAVGVYTWGVLHLAFLDESGQSLACREAVGKETAQRVEGYEPSFVPLHFGCRVDGGRIHEAAVPGYVNPAAVIFGVIAVALTVAVRSHPEPAETTATSAPSST
ncbi:hypothetical protein [Streptomyces sp. NPDC008141]|uniref:hypothetical protein n=1 Tax=Streptomyces sp. NPDC008141 TaxID=3364815 RepID=UPI0036EC1465